MALSCCKKLPSLLRGITSKHVGDHYCLNCLHSYRPEITSKIMKMYAKTMIIVV